MRILLTLLAPLASQALAGDLADEYLAYWQKSPISVPAIARCLDALAYSRNGVLSLDGDSVSSYAWHGVFPESFDEDGGRYREGYFLLTPTRLRFFDSPREAVAGRERWVEIPLSEAEDALINPPYGKFNKLHLKANRKELNFPWPGPRPGEALPLKASAEYPLDQVPQGLVRGGDASHYGTLGGIIARAIDQELGRYLFKYSSQLEAPDLMSPEVLQDFREIEKGRAAKRPPRREVSDALEACRGTGMTYASYDQVGIRVIPLDRYIDIKLKAFAQYPELPFVAASGTEKNVTPVEATAEAPAPTARDAGR